MITLILTYVDFNLRGSETCSTILTDFSDDTPHIYNDTLLDKEAVYTIISNLTDLLQEVFPGKMVYSALGNHDWSPKHYLPPKLDPFYESIAAKWRDWLNESKAIETFNQGTKYS